MATEPVKSVKSAVTLASSASISCRLKRQQLELAAAEAKATIDKELIDKKLKCELALIEDERERVSRTHSRNSELVTIDEWLDHTLEPPATRAAAAMLEPPATPAAAAKMTAPTEAAPAPNEKHGRAPAPAVPADSILQLAYALRDSMDASSARREDRLLTRLSTPRELPTFSGDCIEWLHFKSAFEESSHICNYTESENLWRLRRALKGEAREAVTDLLIGNTSPAVVMEALELRFGQADIIIQHLLSQIRKLPHLPTNYHHELINFATKVNNCIATLDSLNQRDYLRSPEIAATIISKLPSVLLSRWTDYAHDKVVHNNIPKLELLGLFLKREAKMLSVVGVPQTRDYRKPDPGPPSRKHDERQRHFTSRPVFATTATPESRSNNNNTSCPLCKKPHVLTECRTFKRKLKRDRWRFVRSENLCYCCLLSRHGRDTCPAPVCDIDSCGMAHHPLLHYNASNPRSTSTIPAPTSPSRDETVAHVATTAAATRPPAPAVSGSAAALGARAPSAPTSAVSEVMLKVIKVNLSGPKGTVSAYALLDDGASISMIDKTLVNELGLETSQCSPIKFIDAFGIEIFQSEVPKVSVNISGCMQNAENHNVTLRQVDNLNLPKQNLSCVKQLQCNHLLGIKDYVCSECVVPRLLIGEDNYFLLAPLQILHGNKQEPYATRCRLGWCIHGCYGLTHSPVNAHAFHIAHSTHPQAQPEPEASCDVSKLNELVKMSFELDSIGISTLRRENTAHLRAVKILDETSRNIGGQWEVGLPFTKDQLSLPDTFDYAHSRLRGLLKKFQADGKYAEKYCQEMKRLFDNGYARELEDNELSPSHTWYLSHFGVQNPNKPEKLRLVFDCAGKVKGVCLNDFLLTGPDLYNSLLGIMLRFREHKIALIADIKDFFVQIKIRHEDKHVFRFLWQESPDMPLKKCVMESLLFGATCSPFVAQYIKNKNALKYQDMYPEAVDVIIKDHYMDDCLHSCEDESQAIRLVREVTDIHKSGGFEITRWSSNSRSVLDAIPPAALAPAATELTQGATNTHERTLGLMWYPSDDCFGFKIALDRIPPTILDGSESPTKAQMLSILMSVYDIHGFLSPFTIKGKIIFQNVHRSGVDWNCRIHSEEHTLWVSWLADLRQLCWLRIPRHYGSAHEWIDCYTGEQWSSNISDSNQNDIVNVQMHVFCDASSKAYATVVYFRFTRADGRVLVCFVSSKCRVSPLRPVSIPRLELQGALLGARLAAATQREHKDVQPGKRYYWTDSSTVLQWIRSDPRNYKPYVAHRLGEIDELTKSCEWRHVPTAHNAADIATRDDAPPLAYSSTWFQGPTFLRLPEDQWPKDRKFTNLQEDAECEVRAVNVVVADSCSSPVLPDEGNISNWITLVRATARVLLFIKKCQRKTCELDIVLMKEAEDLLIRKSQLDSFNKEIACLKQNKQLPPSCRLRQLTPYLDDAGILRVRGRIESVAGVPDDVRRPAILDGHHRITRLLVEYAHRQALHGANELVVNNLRQRYWVLRLRPTVRSVAARCLFCRHRRAAPQPQRMADLPPDRLQHNRRPFTYTGVDFFGPLEVTIGRSRPKRYCMLFTCLTIRAIHIEVTEDLTTDSTIMALRRMAARRGMPQVIISDNGTNLRGADTELKRSMADLDQEAVREAGAIRGVEWKFIPPGAPEMGGAWERMIRTVKSSLKVILKERAPHPDTLLTLMAEVEALVNSRPITHVSDDPSYPEALTPNHFLIGSSSASPQFGKYDNSDLLLRKRWRVAQRLADMFWSRWVKEYLPTLIPRQKWTSESEGLQVGDYVVLVEPNLERSCWRHGVVSETHAGRDGRVRVVDVRTRTGLLRRPVTRVALLTPRVSDSAN